MSFERAVREFALHLSAERAASSETRRAYLSDIRSFGRFLGAEARPEAADAPAVFRWLADLQRRLEPSTVARKLASLRSFYRFLAREGVCSADPTLGIPSPRTPHRLPRPIAVDECEALAEADAPARSGASRVARLRDRALVELLYGAGLGRRAGRPRRAGCRPPPRRGPRVGQGRQGADRPAAIGRARGPRGLARRP